MLDVTVIIPIAPYHADVAHRAVISVERQTVKCTAIYMQDKKREGPGVLRNRMLEAVTTPKVVFLDADDWITPDFVEKCQPLMRPEKYVYTDWVTGDKIRVAPNTPWCNERWGWHPVTCLLWTVAVRRVGGFDESLTAQEDTDFFLKLSHNSICGIHLSEPLFYYTADGQRSVGSVKSGHYKIIREQLLQRYGGNHMGCCGEQQNIKQYPSGVQQPGDVLAQAQWHGNRNEYGRATGRMYPRMSYPRTTWVAPEDIVIAPQHWRRVDPPPPPQIMGAAQLAQAMTGGREAMPPAPATVAVLDYVPDVARLVEVAKKKLAI